MNEAQYSDHSKIDGAKGAIEKEMEVLEYNTSHAAGMDGPIERGPEYVNTTTGSYDLAIQKFSKHKGLLYKQGNWIYPTLKDNNSAMLPTLDIIPIKMDFTASDIRVEGRTPEMFNTTVPIMVPNYWIINKKVSKDKQAAAMKFLTWMYTSKRGQTFLKDECGFILYNNLKETNSKNTLNNALVKYMAQGDTLSNPFNAAPSNWTKFIGDDLKQNYMVKKTWDPDTYSTTAKKYCDKWKELWANQE
jgi:raffinose/stachyose/melibiose transport system substrate-binding protein